MSKTKKPKKQQWRMADGNLVNIEDMETTHVLNCMRLLERRAASIIHRLSLNGTPQQVAAKLQPIYSTLEAELAKRLKESELKQPPESTVGRAFDFTND